jgi:hypothetical protein
LSPCERLLNEISIYVGPFVKFLELLITPPVKKSFHHRPPATELDLGVPMACLVCWVCCCASQNKTAFNFMEKVGRKWLRAWPTAPH